MSRSFTNFHNFYSDSFFSIYLLLSISKHYQPPEELKTTCWEVQVLLINSSFLQRIERGFSTQIHRVSLYKYLA